MSKTSHKTNGLDLFALAHQAMIENGFMPDESPAIKAELKALMESPPKADDAAIKDLREVLWSSIDDAKSRDLDQVEFAETRADGNIRLLVAIADVDAFVPKGSAIDAHAAEHCTSVYTGIKTFPMLPEELSTDLTSLNANEDRLAIVTELVLSPDGAVLGRDAYRANVKNHARLSYEQIGPWLDGKAPLPDAVEAVVRSQKTTWCD
jgi:exoribonuclease-2